jgi:uncharacterized protein (DUF2147 family)
MAVDGTPSTEAIHEYRCMRRILAASLAGLALALPLQAQSAPARDPSGTWLTEDGRARIRVEKCGPDQDRLCGYVVWLKSPLTDDGKPRVDLKNPDPSKRGRPSLGHQILLGLTPNAEGRYEGKVYNSEEGKNYDVSVWSEEPAKLNIRGCLVVVLCGTQIWTRTTDVLPGQLAAATGAPGGPRPDPEWASKSASPAPAAAGSRPAPKPKS